MPADELRLDDFWDVGEALVVQDVVDVILAFWVLCLDLPGLLVFGLQFV